MKPIKMMSLALMGVLALGIYRASAQPMGIYLKVNVALTLQQQALFGTNVNGDGKTFISTVEKSKLNNKDLLEFMAEMFDTTWPAGAQLRYDIGMAQMVVTDKTGTNVVFYCGDGVSNANRQAYVFLNLHNQPGPFSEKAVDGIPGYAKFTANDQGAIGIYYDNSNDPSVYIDLNGDGLNIDKGYEKVTDISETRSWNKTFTPFAIGSFDDVNAILTGKITASGKKTSPTPP